MFLLSGCTIGHPCHLLGHAWWEEAIGWVKRRPNMCRCGQGDALRRERAAAFLADSVHSGSCLLQVAADHELVRSMIGHFESYAGKMAATLSCLLAEPECDLRESRETADVRKTVALVEGARRLLLEAEVDYQRGHITAVAHRLQRAAESLAALNPEKLLQVLPLLLGDASQAPVSPVAQAVWGWL